MGLLWLIPLSASAGAPSWFEAPPVLQWIDVQSLPEPPPLREVGWTATGAVVAVGDSGFVATDDEHGVLGFLEVPPATTWVGTGATWVYAADAQGNLWAAHGLADAVAGRFLRRPAVPGATAWAAAPDLLVAVRGDEVHVSRDGGRTMRRLVPEEYRRWDRVWATSAGWILVGSAEGGWELSRDRGETWISVEARSATRQRGAVLAAGKDVLAASGAWIESQAEPTRPWTADLRLSAGAPPERDASRPKTSPWSPMPPRPARVQEDVVWLPLLTTRGDSESEPPAGVEVIRTARIEGASTPTGQGWLQDGASDRPPHVGIAVSGALQRVVGVPDGCRPIALDSVAGIGVLRCEALDQERVFTLSASGEWHDEGLVPGGPSLGIDVGPDGTLVLVRPCPEEQPCVALVRSPMELGAPAWREVRGDVLSWRAGEAGVALAITEPVPGAVQVTAHAPDGAATPLLSDPARMPERFDRLNDVYLDDGELVAQWLVFTGLQGCSWGGWSLYDGIDVPLTATGQP